MVRSPAEGSIDGLLEDDQQGSGEALRGIREERAPTSELPQKGTQCMPAGDTPYERISQPGSLAAYTALARHEIRDDMSSRKSGHYRSPSSVEVTLAARLCHVISAAIHRKRYHPAKCTKVSLPLLRYNLRERREASLDRSTCSGISLL